MAGKLSRYAHGVVIDRPDCVTAIEGAYCPIPAPPVLRKRLAEGRYVFTDLGLELRCPACGDYWPADTEFFFPQPGKTGGLHCYCKACYREKTRAAQERKAA